MVKPPKTMEPSSIKDMSKAGRDQTKAFSNDSFHTYIARKIDMQRNQFGNVQLPPTPLTISSQQPQSPLPNTPRSPHKCDKIQQTWSPSVQLQLPRQEQQQLVTESRNNYIEETLNVLASDSKINDAPPTKKLKKKFGVEAILKRLQRRYGVIEAATTTDVTFTTSSTTPTKRRRGRSEIACTDTDNTTPSIGRTAREDDEIAVNDKDVIRTNFSDDGHSNDRFMPDAMIDEIEAVKTTDNGDTVQLHNANRKRNKLVRPDLFFYGIVVLINGYTNPDAETLQRLLQKHGGDVEKYETSRITHIIAERLSNAKANVYKKQQRNPKPVCQPNWITDSVQAYKLLPYQNYILDDVKVNKNVPSVASIFHQRNTTSIATTSTEEVNIAPAAYCTTIMAAPKLAVHGHELSMIDESEYRNQGSMQEPNSTLHDGAVKEQNLSETGDEFIESKEVANEVRNYNGKVRTVGTDPNFLESFFASSRLSFIGSYRQRTRQQSPPMKRNVGHTITSNTTERFIFHVDMDCFFASVVLRKFPQFKDRPVAISHNSNVQRGKSTNVNNTEYGEQQMFKDSTSECATCNYVARKYGIKKGMFLSRAKALCPNLIVLPYDYDGYEEVSDIVSDILDGHAMKYNGYVEHVSCDEAYMEIFVHPTGIKVPQEIAADVAEAIREEIFSLTQCTASVGVATNKFLAKLATDHVKPNRSFVMDDFQAILKSVKLCDLYGIGYRMRQRLDDEGLVFVKDIWDLDDRAETELCRILGAGLGKKIYGFCHGRDDRGIQASERKTIGAECNYGVRFDGAYDVDHMVEGLCKEVEKRMANVGVKGIKVTLKVKQRKHGAGPSPKYLGHGSCNNLSKSVEVRNSKPTRNWKSFFMVAMEMYNELKVDKDDVRGMGIVISKLIENDSDASTEASSMPVHSISKWFNKNTAKKDSEIFARKVDFVLPAESTNEENQMIDDDSTNSDIIYIETATADDGTNTRYDNDIALPAFSQIHMSQVNELPSPMRKQIISKMHNAQPTKGPDISDAIDQHDPPRDIRYRQADVKRMFRLASVKSGAATLLDKSGQAISLTQLDCLPLELQLEIANEDSNGVGPQVISPVKKSRKRHVTADRTMDAVQKVTTEKNDIPPMIHRDDTIDNDPRSYYKVDFMKDNLLPFIAYMDEHIQVDVTAIQQVSDFLCICIHENRLSETVILLQHMKNRTDRWCTHGFEVIFDTVNRHVGRCYRATLDKEWIRQL